MAQAPKTLDELFHDTLKDIYFAEKKILATLPKMAKAAQNVELKAAFEKHRHETEGQVERLDQAELGHTDAASLLQETLDEEEATDQALTKIAKTAVNQEAEAA